MQSYYDQGMEALPLMKSNRRSGEDLPIGAFIRVETKRHLETTRRPGP